MQTYIAIDPDTLDQLNVRQIAILEELKEFGVGLQDDSLANSDFYMDKHVKVLERFTAQGYRSTMNPINADDLSLSDRAIIFFHDIQLHLSTITYISLGLLISAIYFFN